MIDLIVCISVDTQICLDVLRFSANVCVCVMVVCVCV
jgi:hypothetical protein